MLGEGDTGFKRYSFLKRAERNGQTGKTQFSWGMEEPSVMVSVQVSVRMLAPQKDKLRGMSRMRLKVQWEPM